MLSYNEFKEAVLAESVEQLDELSKGTLGSYMKKSADSAFHAQKDIEGAARKQRAGLNSFNASKIKSGESDEEKARATKAKRVKGMNVAYKKLQKEEIEVLESLLAKLDEEEVEVLEGLLAKLDEVHVSQKDWEEDQALKSRPSKFDAKYNGKPEAKSKHYVSQKDWEEDQALKSRPSKFDKKLTKEEVEVLEGLLAKLED